MRLIGINQSSFCLLFLFFFFKPGFPVCFSVFMTSDLAWPCKVSLALLAYSNDVKSLDENGSCETIARGSPIVRV